MSKNIECELAKEIGFRKSIIHTLPDLVWLKDIEGVYLACNRRFEDFFGASEAEIIGKTDYDFVNSEQADFFREHDKKAMGQRSPSVYKEWITFANDGHREFVETTKTTMYNDAKELIGILGIAYDITKSYKKTGESEQALQGVLETSFDGFWTVDYQGNLIDVNSTYCQQSGYAREELLTMHIFQLDAIESPLDIEERLKMIRNQKRFLFESKHRRKDGSIWDVEISITNSDVDGGRVFAFFKDITTRKEMEKALKKSENMLLSNSRQAAMGEMLSMIAHQWRQPLNIMGLAIANVQTKEALNILTQPELEENFHIISSNITHMSTTIDDFRDYLKPIQEKESVVMESVLNVVLEMVGKSFEHNSITLSVQNNSHRPLLLHKSKLIQVLLNLLDNAKYALISSKVADASVSLCVHETEDMIRIAVCDNGGGISKEAMEHLGEPYFTTKKLNGTGLGLHIAKTIMENYFEGTLTWHNENRGACFILTLKAD
ncbi:MAG: PAS domain-containing sensor histidine kinase [Sulfuricurvum sp.]|jgi:PAS domain S-box-containing protein